MSPLLSTALIFIVLVNVLALFGNIFLIGKPREPLTHGGAVVSALFCAFTIAVLIIILVAH